MTPRQVVLPVAAVVGGVLGALVGSIVSRQMIEHGLYGHGAGAFVLQVLLSALYVLGSALPVLAAVATRLPGVAVGTAFVISLVAVPVNALVFRGDLDLRPTDLVFTLLEVLVVGAVDVAVLLHRGRPLPLTPVLVAVLVVVLLEIVLTFGRYLTFPGGGFHYLWIVARQPTFLVNVFVVSPVMLFGAGLLGWSISRSTAAPAAAAPGTVAPPPPPPGPYGAPR